MKGEEGKQVLFKVFLRVALRCEEKLERTRKKVSAKTFVQGMQIMGILVNVIDKFEHLSI
jgi:hypothetical protein